MPYGQAYLNSECAVAVLHCTVFANRSNGPFGIKACGCMHEVHVHNIVEREKSV